MKPLDRYRSLTAVAQDASRQVGAAQLAALVTDQTAERAVRSDPDGFRNVFTWRRDRCYLVEWVSHIMSTITKQNSDHNRQLLIRVSEPSRC